MKNYLKIFAVIATMSLFSFSKEKSVTAEQKKMNEIVKKYGLERRPGTPSANAKRFSSSTELEAYLKSRKNVVKAKATTKIRKFSNLDPVGTYGNVSTSVTSTNNNYYAQLDFNQFLLDGYPNLLNLWWCNGNTCATSSLGASSGWTPFPGQIGFWYEQVTTTNENGTLIVNGTYDEEYMTGSGVYARRYKFRLDAGWDSSSINANAVIEL